MLVQRDVAAYLLERQLIDEQTVVDGNLTVIDASQRNCNFKVITEPGPSYMLKQGLGPSGNATIVHEAATYQHLHFVAPQQGFDHYLPRYYGYDPDQRVLILELIRNAQDLRNYQAERARFPVRLAKDIGKALAALHHVTTKDGIGAAGSAGIDEWMPWVLSIQLPSLDLFQKASGANLQLIKIIQQFSEFSQLLNRLSQERDMTTLIHGDIKWDNWLFVPRSTIDVKPSVKLIDWEVSAFGDPCWDIGSVFSGYLSYWLRSIPITGDSPSDQRIELARVPLESMRPAIRTFWRSYVRRKGFSMETADNWLLRSVRYGAARLIQTAFEEQQTAARLTANGVRFLQLSLNILKRPEEAVIHLLGLPLGETRWA